MSRVIAIAVVALMVSLPLDARANETSADDAASTSTGTLEKATPTEPSSEPESTANSSDAKRSDAKRSRHDAHVGVNMRTDLGTHQFRLEFGARRGDYELYLVLDPSSSRDGQTDLDVVGAWWFRPDKWSVFFGWRNTAFNLLGQNRWHENLLLGIVSRLPSLGPKWLRYEVGLELRIDVVRHGSNVPAEWINFSSQRAFTDLVNLSLFARLEIAVPF